MRPRQKKQYVVTLWAQISGVATKRDQGIKGIIIGHDVGREKKNRSSILKDSNSGPSIIPHLRVGRETPYKGETKEATVRPLYMLPIGAKLTIRSGQALLFFDFG